MQVLNRGELSLTLTECYQTRFDRQRPQDDGRTLGEEVGSELRGKVEVADNFKFSPQYSPSRQSVTFSRDIKTQFIWRWMLLRLYEYADIHNNQLQFDQIKYNSSFKALSL